MSISPEMAAEAIRGRSLLLANIAVEASLRVAKARGASVRTGEPAST